MTYEIDYAAISEIASVFHVKQPRKARKPVARKPSQPTVADLQALLAAKGLKFTKKHTKPELARLLAGEAYFAPAAYAAAKARRDAAKAS